MFLSTVENEFMFPLPDDHPNLRHPCRYLATRFCELVCTRWKLLPETCTLSCENCGWKRACPCGKSNLPFDEKIPIDSYGRYDPDVTPQWWMIFKPIIPRSTRKMSAKDQERWSPVGLVEAIKDEFELRHGYTPQNIFHVDHLFIFVAGPAEEKCVSAISAGRKKDAKKGGLRSLMLREK